MAYNVIAFAKEELTKYLSLLGVTAEIELGLLGDFGVCLSVEDPFFDDAIAISVKDRKGYIAGSNERSVLMGVYRLLTEWGITFLRPGGEGTVYPKVCHPRDAEILERASKRFRSICIEGADSIENVLNMIEWMPKVGFNSYFIQFALPHVFFEHWYTHEGNPFKEAEPYTIRKTAEYHRLMIEEIKKRGMLLQTIGHGWACFPFGLPANGWHRGDSFPPEYEKLCAMVKGERKVWQNIPLQTQLCYSNEYVRDTMVKAVLNYVEENPEADVVHFWTGDYFNNTCECPSCSEGRYADHYMRMVNMITDSLAKQGKKTKIIFLVAYNSSHPPLFEQVRNTENVILLFAPICRNYFTAFPAEHRMKEVPPYEVNGFSDKECNSVDKNLAFLYQWQQQYKGDCADFDYHLMWDHFLDAGGESIARIIHQDMQNLGGLGINSFVSCQLQRNAFPTSLAMTVMAKTLWDEKTEFETVRREVYSAAFGEESVDLMCRYFSTLSDAFDLGILRKHREYDREIFREKMEKAIALMESFGEEIAKHGEEKDPAKRKSWELLEHHRNAYRLVGKRALALLDENKELAEAYWKEASDYLFRNEDAVQDVVDTFFFSYVIKDHITVTNESPFVTV